MNKQQNAQRKPSPLWSNGCRCHVIDWPEKLSWTNFWYVAVVTLWDDGWNGWYHVPGEKRVEVPTRGLGRKPAMIAVEDAMRAAGVDLPGLAP